MVHTIFPLLEAKMLPYCRNNINASASAHFIDALQIALQISSSTPDDEAYTCLKAAIRILAVEEIFAFDTSFNSNQSKSDFSVYDGYFGVKRVEDDNANLFLNSVLLSYTEMLSSKKDMDITIPTDDWLLLLKTFNRILKYMLYLTYK